MSYHIQWYNDDQTIIMITFHAEMTYEMLHRMFDDTAALLNTISHKAFVIHDLTELKLRMNVDIAALGKVGRQDITNHPNRMFSYFANPSGKARMLLDLSTRLFPAMMRNVQTVSDVDEALRRIAAHTTAESSR